MSLRASPQTGVAIPLNFRNVLGIATPACALVRDDADTCYGFAKRSYNAKNVPTSGRDVLMLAYLGDNFGNSGNQYRGDGGEDDFRDHVHTVVHQTVGKAQHIRA